LLTITVRFRNGSKIKPQSTSDMSVMYTGGPRYPSVVAAATIAHISSVVDKGTDAFIDSEYKRYAMLVIAHPDNSYYKKKFAYYAVLRNLK
jgi:hypothetical protein